MLNAYTAIITTATPMLKYSTPAWLTESMVWLKKDGTASAIIAKISMVAFTPA